MLINGLPVHVKYFILQSTIGFSKGWESPDCTMRLNRHTSGQCIFARAQVWQGASQTNLESLSILLVKPN